MPDVLTPAERAAISAYRGPVRMLPPGATSDEAHGAIGDYRTAAKRRFMKRRKQSAAARKIAGQL